MFFGKAAANIQLVYFDPPHPEPNKFASKINIRYVVLCMAGQMTYPNLEKNYVAAVADFADRPLTRVDARRCILSA